MEAKFKSVNQHIKDGLNRHVKITGKGGGQRWTLAYPSDDEPVGSPFYGLAAGDRHRRPVVVCRVEGRVYGRMFLTVM